MLPVLFAMFLQAMYGAVDLLVVGKYCGNADVSAVSTGSQIILTLTNLLVSLSMGITVAVGEKIGQKKPDEASMTIGTGLVIFAILGVMFTIISVFGAALLAKVMQAPKEAFDVTVSYIRICGAGFLVITGYNLLGSIFRGLGDSKTPLLAVGIACVINIFGDLILVAGFHLGAAGAAIATVAAQAGSVILSLMIISRRELPFTLRRNDLRFDTGIIRHITGLGLPLALQGTLVSLSFLVILAIVNNLGVVESAGMGIANRIIGFIMLTPASFGQAMAAFVAQNAGAKLYRRATGALRYGIIVSFCCGLVMGTLSFVFGEKLALLFTVDRYAAAAAHSYLKAYAIDCLLTAFLFCFVGFFNGIGITRFVMLQGIIGAFCVRVPASFLLSKWKPVSLFKIGLATPMSTALQIVLCFGCLRYVYKKYINTTPVNDTL